MTVSQPGFLIQSQSRERDDHEVAARLSLAQIEAFRRDGFIAPVDTLPEAEARALRTQLEVFDRTLPPGPVAARERRKLQVRLPWARTLIEDARILDVMEQPLGPDILEFPRTFFIFHQRAEH